MKDSTPHTSTPVEVLFLTYGMSVGGAETLLVSVLNALDRSRFVPVVVSLAGPAVLEAKLNPGTEVLHFSRRSRFDTHPAREIAALVHGRSIRTVLTLGIFSYLFLRPAFKTMPSLRVLVSLHSTRPHSVKGYLRSLLQTRLLRRSDTLVSVCRNQADYLSRLYHIPRTQFTTVYNGVDTSHWTPAPSSFDRRTFREQLQMDADSPVILQVAQFRIEKRQEDAVRALAHLRETGFPLPYLVFVGGGEPELRERVKVTAERLRVIDRIRFCGQQSDVLPYYWGSDFFTLSSRSETFPMAILEAMATGLPCVMTDLGGAREVIEEGVNGYIGRPADPQSLGQAWKHLLSRRDTWNRREIRERVQRLFSFEACVRGYETLLAGGVEGGPAFVSPGERHSASHRDPLLSHGFEEKPL